MRSQRKPLSNNLIFKFLASSLSCRNIYLFTYGLFLDFIENTGEGKSYCFKTNKESWILLTMTYFVTRTSQLLVAQLAEIGILQFRIAFNVIKIFAAYNKVIRLRALVGSFRIICFIIYRKAIKLLSLYTNYRKDIITPGTELYELKKEYDLNPTIQLRRKKN